MADCICSQMNGLIALDQRAGDTANPVRAVFSLLTEESLDQPARGPFGGLSALNADGLPFQWVLRLTPSGLDWGFVCEAGRPGAAVTERLAVTLDRIEQACAAAGCAPPVELRAIAASLMPDGREEWPQHWRSAAWIGVATQAGRVRLKPYFNLNRGGARERWLRVGRLLKMLGRDQALAKLCDLSASCSDGWWPTGLALDLSAEGGIGRIKIYFRSSAGTPELLARWYDAVGVPEAVPALRTLLDLAGRSGGDCYPDRAFFLTLEIHADESLSLKTDLAVTKWAEGDAQVIEAAETVASRLGLVVAPLGPALRALGLEDASRDACAVARFVGLGCEPDGGAHLNLYLAPTLPPYSRGGVTALRPTEPPPASEALGRGLRCLFEARNCAHWEDYCLPVGPSDAWITAYVLTRLARIERAGLLGVEDRASVGYGLDWLLAARRPGGGWGYNASVPEDADSTAWAVLALRAWGREAPHEALALLRACLSVDGAATYPPETSAKSGWSVGCADVAATVVAALRACGEERDVHIDPRARAYWWVSPLYVRAIQAEFGAAHGDDADLAEFHPHGSFERALLLTLGGCGELQQSALLRAQLPCGLWPPSARLRLVMSDDRAPWRQIDSGPVHLDIRGILTTATVLASLAGSLHPR